MEYWLIWGDIQLKTILFTVQVKTILFIYTIPYNWRRFGLYHTTEDDYITLLIGIPYKWRRLYSTTEDCLYSTTEDCYFRVLSLYPTTEDDLQYKWRLIHMLITNLVVYYTNKDYKSDADHCASFYWAV